ncbi:MAG: outer membrane lipid asymmetry maintenance protein MlaD [Burkholderiales bacterium]
MGRSMLDLWVGIFVVAGITALVILAFKVGNMSSLGSGETYEISANFDNIGGLKPRAPIKSAGVVVGRVKEITFNNERFMAKVTMAIGKDYKFPKDTTASILTSGLLGEQYVGLEGGGDDQLLKSGDNIRLTQSAVVLEKLISQFLFDKAAEGGTAKK